MLPQFPIFKRLETSDRIEIISFTSQFAPYSDFNFASMWSWDIQEDMHVSVLNGNLVVKFNDYVTGKPFYSFLGKSDIQNTIHELLKFIERFLPVATIRIVPEDSIDDEIITNEFSIENELDHFDYIYQIEKLSLMKGSKYEVKRNLINRFTRLYPEAKVVSLDIQDRAMQQRILDLNTTWASNKINGGKDIDSTNETIALERFFTIATNENFIAIGIIFREELIACSLSEMIGDYVLSHFFKGNETYVGVYAYLMRECAKIFFLKNKHYFNYEQDLGLPGLRQAKQLFRPTFFLKKYSISKKVPLLHREIPKPLVYLP